MKKIVFIFSLYFIKVESECCASHTVSFVPKEDPSGACDNRVPRAFRHIEVTPGEGSFFGFSGSQIIPGHCKVKVCANGRPAKSAFCGKGLCNIFGCQCIGGCIKGNPKYPWDVVRNFMDKYSNDVYMPDKVPSTTTTTTTEDPFQYLRCGRLG